MSQSLLQSALGGHSSFAFGTGGGTSSSISVTIPNDTVVNSFLVLVCCHHQTLATGTGLMSSAFNNPAGQLVGSWRTSGAAQYSTGSGAGAHKVATQIFFVPPVVNTSIIAAGSTITIAVGVGSGSATGSELFEFAFYEFSGINKVFTGTGVIDTSAVTVNVASQIPATANLSTTKVDLIIVNGVGNGSALTAGSGYTLGTTFNNVSATAQTQYQLDVPSGSIATAFGSGVQPLSGAQAMAFLPPAVTAKNSYGFFFG